MRVLVTGGAGFLGSAICRQLLARGDEVIAYQRSSSDELEKAGARVVAASITDFDSLTKAVENTDAVIHTAAKAGLWGEYDKYFLANVTGT